jgi:hypothetical protein
VFLRVRIFQLNGAASCWGTAAATRVQLHGILHHENREFLPHVAVQQKAEAAVPDRCLFYGSQLCATSDLAPLEQTNSVLDPDTGVSISYDNVNLVPLS